MAFNGHMRPESAPCLTFGRTVMRALGWCSQAIRVRVADGWGEGHRAWRWEREWDVEWWNNECEWWDGEWNRIGWEMRSEVTLADPADRILHSVGSTYFLDSECCCKVLRKAQSWPRVHKEIMAESPSFQAARSTISQSLNRRHETRFEQNKQMQQVFSQISPIRPHKIYICNAGSIFSRPQLNECNDKASVQMRMTGFR
ncbi:hypothetical protein BDN71DRAFT_1433710 [Pleurotus eryngii]|uniref:Uncharacterized protein n=1 Tax=Pleurotus eryngii TaxID=5323 RepID=A0A9P5ZU47_PLEER|nr:hypothetical protein BDN71DRAFT_1433710 [Pleurotus eryngii]